MDDDFPYLSYFKMPKDTFWNPPVQSNLNMHYTMQCLATII